MGTDLTLLILSPIYNGRDCPADPLPKMMIEVNRRSCLWPMFDDLPLKEVDTNFGMCVFGDEVVKEDRYGGKLQWTTAGALVDMTEHGRPEGIGDDPSNMVIWRMLEQLERSRKVVLFWH